VVVRGNSRFVRDTLTGGVAGHTFAYGQAGDVQLMGDWDGNGTDTPGVVRGTSWFLRTTNDPAVTTTVPAFDFGQASDQRVAGDWNGDGNDTLGWMGTSGGQNVQTVTSRVLANLRPGEIVLMHVGSHPTDGSTLDADALPGIVAELKRRGYGFVTIYDSI
jgi:peptidoglycan/xylan/chitin deacetylase (PgdA/CDA1 family)